MITLFNTSYISTKDSRGLVNAFSKWPEVIEMNSSTTTKTEKALQHALVIHSLPEQLVSDMK